MMGVTGEDGLLEKIVLEEEVRTINTNSLFAYANQIFGDDTEAELLEGIDLSRYRIRNKSDKEKLEDLTVEHLKDDPDYWISNYLSTAIFHNADTKLPGGTFEAGKHFVWNLPELRNRLAFVKLLTVPMFATLASKENSKYNRTRASVTYTRLNKHKYQIQMRYRDDITYAINGKPIDPSICQGWYVGSLHMYMSLFTKNFDVKEVECVTEGADTCTYELTWSSIPFRQKLGSSLYTLLSKFFDDGEDTLFHLQEMVDERDDVVFNLEKRVSEKTQQVQEVQTRLKQKNEELEKNYRRLQEAKEQLFRYSYYDTLTDIPNRRYFNEYFRREWKMLERTSDQKHPYVSIILADIDYFKKYNDGYGHTKGDECLYEVAQAIQASVRESDFVARYGGEEFVVVLPHTREAGAIEVASKIFTTLKEANIPHEYSEVSSCVSLSMGVATGLTYKTRDMETLTTYADDALYKAKKNGRNQLSVYTKDHE
jgi:diguanylate cyclase (GGDEF)-like protein